MSDYTPKTTVSVASRAANPVLTRVLKLAVLGTVAIAAAVAVVGGIIGYLISGWMGAFSAFIGAVITLVFAGITALCMWLGSRQGGYSFLGIIMGGWLMKFVIFLAILALVTSIHGINKGVLFGSIVVAILGSAAADGIAATKSRVPYVDEPSAESISK